jgi:hypothetical protein
MMEYANELFGDTHVTESAKRPANYDQNLEKIETLYKKAIALKPESAEANLSLSKHYYNQALFIEEDMSKIKGTATTMKPKGQKEEREHECQVA